MIAFNKYYNKFNILSVSLVIISLLLLTFKGLNFGIDFKDGNSQNWLDGNIRLLCANCYYSFNGYFPSAKKFCK